jgi:hypothetical protein
MMGMLFLARTFRSFVFEEQLMKLTLKIWKPKIFI